MKLRFRLTVFFSLLFSLLMIFTVFIINYMFEKSRERDFSHRLWSQAYYSYSEFYHISLPDSIQKKVNEYHPNIVTRLQVLIADPTGNIQHSFAKTQAKTLPRELLNRVQKEKTYHYHQSDLDFLVVHISAPLESYILLSGYDKFGWQRVNNLTHILTTVAIAGVVLIIFSAIIFVNLVTKPLIRLGLQMQGISEKNLQERIEIKSGRLNYEEAQIATHFNGMLDRLERAFEIQKSFVHHASHELRTPLATMLAQTELALRKNLTIEEARRTLESLKDDQQEMVELTNSLLLLSRYEKDQTSPAWPVIRLDELLYDTMAMVKRMLPNVNVSLEFAQVPESELFLSIQGNDSLVRSAFRNLIKNAWLYSADKSVAITIDSTSTHIYLHFDNNGSLLTTEEQERLFVPFFRASNSTQKKGFGLGLNIIQRIIALHNGSISYVIYDNLNRFTLQFPKLQSGSAIENLDL